MAFEGDGHWCKFLKLPIGCSLVRCLFREAVEAFVADVHDHSISFRQLDLPFPVRRAPFLL